MTLMALALCSLVLWGRQSRNQKIHSAARDGDLRAVEALLKDDPNLIFSRDRWTVEDEMPSECGATPLHTAAFHGRKEVVKFLLAKNADVNARDNFGETPLFIAVERGHKDVAELLLSANADVNAANSCGETPLLIASGAGHKELVQLLLTYKAEVNSKDSLNRETPLHYAARRKNKEIVDLLQQYGARE